MNISRDLLAGAVILTLVAGLWYVTSTFDTDPLGMTQGMPATAMPRIVLSLIGGLTVLMMIQALARDPDPVGGLPPWPTIATAALLAVAAMLFDVLGVPLVFAGVCATLPILWGSRNYAAVAVFALAAPVVIYVVFKLLLGLRMPMGPLAALGL